MLFRSSGTCDKVPSARAAQTLALEHSPEELQKPLAEFSTRLEAGAFALLAPWTLEQRRAILAELQSMRRLEYLMSQLNRWLAQIPGPASNRAPSRAFGSSSFRKVQPLEK